MQVLGGGGVDRPAVNGWTRVYCSSWFSITEFLARRGLGEIGAMLPNGQIRALTYDEAVPCPGPTLTWVQHQIRHERYFRPTRQGLALIAQRDLEKG